MLHMISISLQIVKERDDFWVGFAENCGDSLTHMVLEADTFKIIYRSPIRGSLMLEGRVIISLTPKISNIQLLCQMVKNQLGQIPQLSTSNQGMMMVQLQASLCQSSTQMSLLEGPCYYPWRQWGETMGKSHQKCG